jgi:acyl carrier protein
MPCPYVATPERDPRRRGGPQSGPSRRAGIVARKAGGNATGRVRLDSPARRPYNAAFTGNPLGRALGGAARSNRVDKAELVARLKELIVEGLKLVDLAPADIKEEDALFGEGLGLDSLDALELALIVEENFGVTIPDEDVGRNAFQSVSVLADYILQHRP